MGASRLIAIAACVILVVGADREERIRRITQLIAGHCATEDHGGVRLDGCAAGAPQENRP
jgi:hypothetical protein